MMYRISLLFVIYSVSVKCEVKQYLLSHRSWDPIPYVTGWLRGWIVFTIMLPYLRTRF